MSVFVHMRLLRPILAIVLLCMSLPLVLGGFGRNTFINLGFALANSAIFYGAILFVRSWVVSRSWDRRWRPGSP